MNHLNIAYLAPLLLVIGANSCYHFISKNTSASLNPFFGLTATYSVALVFSIILFILTKNACLAVEISNIKVTNFLMGIAVLGVESGWILMYRNGWEISKASIIANICVAVVLFIVGFILFREDITAKKMVGLLVCILGVYLLNSK